MKGQINLFDELIKQRDRERKDMKKAKVIVDGEKLPTENNPMGRYRWYLHPSKKEVPHKSLLLCVLEIPPNSKSGKQLTQGGRTHYVWEGKGYSEIDGVRHDWKQGDVILLPIKAKGTIHQHFNTDDKKPVKLIACEPNIYADFGVDLGSGFEQLEDSPDY